jgi:hypothetical protein
MPTRLAKGQRKSSVDLEGSPQRSESAIWHRLVRPEGGGLSLAAARSLLKLDFDEEDRSRMHELVVKNRDDALNDEEKAELTAYRRVGLLLDLLHSKARTTLKRRPARP